MKNYIVPIIFCSLLYCYIYILGSWTFRSGIEWYPIVTKNSFLFTTTLIQLGLIAIVAVIILDTLIFRTKHPKFIYTLCGILFCYETTLVSFKLLQNFSDPLLLNFLGMHGGLILLLIMGTFSYRQLATLNKSFKLVSFASLTHGTPRKRGAP